MTKQQTNPSRPLKSAPQARVAGLGLLLGTAMLLAPLPARAVTLDSEIVVDAECVKTCLTDLRACVAEARADLLDCSIENGCVELAASARLACAADKTASLCLEARAEYKECIQPCRAELRADVKSCQNSSMSCLRDECELTDLPAQCSRVAVTVN